MSRAGIGVRTREAFTLGTEPAARQATGPAGALAALPIKEDSIRCTALRPLTKANLRNCASVSILKGEQAGRLVRFTSRELRIGRSVDADLTLVDSSISREHARFFLADGRFYVQDMNSTNGTFLDKHNVRQPRQVNDGDLVQLGPRQILRFNLTDVATESAAVELYESTVLDVTTGAFNRRYMDAQLSSYMLRHDSSLVVLFVDIDNFKSVNDKHGHPMGDTVLRIIAALINRLLRPTDTLIRYGGDEFVVLCRDTTMRNGAILAERIRAGVARLLLSPAGNDLNVTVSVGVSASAIANGLPAGALVGAADRAMYSAKCEGKNAVSESDNA